MVEDEIESVEIDEAGRLCVKPATQALTLIYREAVEVNWDAGRKCLFSPTPREWTYPMWFRHIVATAEECGFRLHLTDGTAWINVPEELRSEMTSPARGRP